MLLGTHPPLLSARRLVRAGELFGLNSGTIRVALSRMVANQEVVAEDRGYRLIGPLLDRQRRQDDGRTPPIVEWTGRWEVIIAHRDLRSEARSDVVAATRTLRLAELRDGVWMRPSNLSPDRDLDARAVVHEACTTLICGPGGVEEPSALAAKLWDLRRWQHRATELTSEINTLTAQLETGRVTDLGTGFITSASVVRHLTEDPVLPEPLTPRGWPAAKLRAEYSEFDTAYRRVLRDWLDAG